MTILAAIDGEHVPSSVVEVGYDLAQQYDDELVVLHVMPQDVFEENQESRGEGGLTSLPYTDLDIFGAEPDERTETTNLADSTPSYSIPDGETDAASVARKVVEETLDEDSTVTVQGSVGEPVEEILEGVHRHDARYLVIGGRKRSAVGKAVFGSITQSVLLNVDLPVVAVMRDE